MAYVKNIWVDQDVERPKTYEVTNNEDGSITLTDSFGLVTELGTPVDEVNMNHIEDGIAGCAIRKHNLTETFELGEWVLGGSGDNEGLYKSLISNNIGNAITDTTAWEQVKMGGASGRNVGEVITSTLPLTDAGLHLLDGSLILGGGIYQGFVDYIADLYNDTKVYNPSAFTVVGSPTITADGIASGFSNSNYVIKDTIINPNIIRGSFTVNSKTSSESGFIFQVAGVANSTLNLFKAPTGYIQIYQGDSYINYVPASSYKIGIPIYYEIGISGTTVTLKLIQNNNVIAEKTGEVVNNVSGTIVIGKNFDGSIDLKQFSITVDGVEVFNGSKPANYFTTEALWQQSVTTYGSCGKFVYNSTNNTVRLPKVSDILQSTTDINALGDLIEAGLPNITGGVKNVTFDTYNTSNVYGAFNSITNVSNATEGSSDAEKHCDITFSASGSNSIYGNSLTVQPQTIKAFVYIVIANSTKTSIQVDIDEIATDLNNKAGTDLANVTDSAKVMMAGMGMPSNRYIDLTLGASGSTYTAPANGWFCLKNNAGGANPLLLNNQTNGMSIMQSGGIGGFAGNTIYLPCSKGDIVQANYTAPSGSITNIYFIYAQGSKN